MRAYFSKPNQSIYIYIYIDILLINGGLPLLGNFLTLGLDVIQLHIEKYIGSLLFLDTIKDFTHFIYRIIIQLKTFLLF